VHAFDSRSINHSTQEVAMKTVILSASALLSSRFQKALGL